MLRLVGQGGVALLQERGKAPSDCCIVLRCEVSREVRRKGSQKVAGARGGAEAQQQPRCLDVVDGGDARQEPVMVVALMPELARDERIMSQRGAERCETLRFWRESPVSDPDALFTLAKVSDVGGLLAGGVPDSCFALVQTDSCPVPPRGRESIVERAHALGRCDDVRIEEGEPSLAIPELALEVAKGFVLRQRVKRGHQRIALFAAFALTDDVCAVGFIVPGVRSGRSIELAGKGKEGLKLRPCVQRTQHGTSGDVIESADRVNRQHGRSRARFSGGTEKPPHSLRPCAGAEPELVRHACLLQVWGKVLRQHAANEPTEDVADHKRAHTAIGLTRRPTRIPSSTSEGTSALASRTAAPCNRRASSSSSSRMRMCSLVAADGPGAEPRRALRKQRRKAGRGGGAGLSLGVLTHRFGQRGVRSGGGAVRGHGALQACRSTRQLKAGR